MTVALEAGLVGRDEPALCSFYTGVLGFALVEGNAWELLAEERALPARFNER